MKLSEMSRRDLFALEALPMAMSLCMRDSLEPGQTRAQRFAEGAYNTADAMLAESERRELREISPIEYLTKRLRVAETSVEVLRTQVSNVTAERDEIWSEIGVTNQMDAMQIIRGLYAELRVASEHSHD